MDRVELHFHLLPDVDDGPPDLGVALALAREAVRDGTGLVTCTPHAAYVDIAEVPERVRELQAALVQAGIDLEVRPAPSSRGTTCQALGGAELETVAQGPPGPRWLLLEAPLPGTGTPEGLADSARELREHGFGVLIGHPERSPGLVRDPGAVEALLTAGDRLQVNASSLTGYHGAGARAAALDLVATGRAAVIASDAHQPGARAPRLSDAVEVLRREGMPAARGRGARGRRAAGAARGRVRAAHAPGRLKLSASRAPAEDVALEPVVAKGAARVQALARGARSRAGARRAARCRRPSRGRALPQCGRARERGQRGLEVDAARARPPRARAST